MRSSAPIPLIFALLGACARAEQSSRLPAAPIAVLDKTAGCNGTDTPEEVLRRMELHYTWEPAPGGYRLEERFVPEEEIRSLRALLLARRKTPPDLLARIGIDPDVITRHRDEALRTALGMWSDAEAGQPLPQLDPEVDPCLSYECLEFPILFWVQGRGYASTEQRCFEVVLPGEPTITVSSHGLIPWMLPWKVTIGTESWEVADPDISRALLPLADPEGNCIDLLDGSQYWTTGFWLDASFWEQVVGVAVRHPPRR